MNVRRPWSTLTSRSTCKKLAQNWAIASWRIKMRLVWVFSVKGKVCHKSYASKVNIPQPFCSWTFPIKEPGKFAIFGIVMNSIRQKKSFKTRLINQSFGILCDSYTLSTVFAKHFKRSIIISKARMWKAHFFFFKFFQKILVLWLYRPLLSGGINFCTRIE